MLRAPINSALAIDTITTSHFSSSISPNKEAPKSTIVSIEKHAQSCVIAKLGTVGSNYNHEENTKSAEESPIHQKCLTKSTIKG